VALGHWQLGFASFALGEYTAARAHLQEVISFYEPQEHHQTLVSLRGYDVSVSALSFDACCLWALGYPEQASRRSQEALALAREFDHPFSLADGLTFGGCLYTKMSRDAEVLKGYAEELIRLSNENSFAGWLGNGICFRGEALSMLGQVQEGMAAMREGIAILRSRGGHNHLTGIVGSLAEAQAKAGQPGEGLVTLTEALALVEETGEREREAELHRLRGELLLMQGDEAGAEASVHMAEQSFQYAIKVARRQNAKSWELRATTSLATLWQKQGKADEARLALEEIYGWFTEGFDTPDLKDAELLLNELT
jgi:predicted ATPase